LVNHKELMGDYRNSRLANVIAWSTSIIVIVYRGGRALGLYGPYHLRKICAYTMGRETRQVRS
jgi:hypothetical protein